LHFWQDANFNEVILDKNIYTFKSGFVSIVSIATFLIYAYKNSLDKDKSFCINKNILANRRESRLLASSAQ